MTPVHLFPLQGKSPLARQTGLSMVELLVALGLGLILLAGIGSIYVGSKQTYRMQEANARVQETGRFALEVIGRSLRQAGADGNINATSINALPARCLQDIPCEDSGGTCQATGSTQTPAGTTCAFVGGVCVATNQCFALQGINGGATDSLALQYYGAMGGSRDCAGGNVAADAIVTDVYSLNGTDLRCTGNVGGTQPLVSDVEDIQILYGVDTDGDQTANIYTSTPSSAFPVPADGIHWNNVVTARVCVMVRSTEQGLATAGQTPLDCPHALDPDDPAAATVFNDTRLHRAFVATFNLRNRVSNVP